MEGLSDITIVSKTLGVSSRALRFYEQKGIVESTQVSFENRRKYTAGQIRNIKKVIVLRSLGLSVSKIKELISENGDLTTAIIERKVQITAQIVGKSKEIRLLQEAMSIIESGGDIYTEQIPRPRVPVSKEEVESISKSCTECIIFGELETCYEHFTDMLSDNFPLGLFKQVRKNFLQPLGKFIAYDKLTFDDEVHNVLYQHLKYENLGLMIKYLFFRTKVHGLWFDYLEY